MRNLMYGLALVVLAQTPFPAVASRGAAHAPASEEVRYSDLDLRTEAGVDRLDRRIKTAVAKVCGSPPPASTLDIAKNRRCRKDTAAMTRPQRDKAIHLARSAAMGAVVARLEISAAPQRD